MSTSKTLEDTPRWLMLRNAHRFFARTKAERKQPLWKMVSEITGHGSTYSINICEELGWEPHAKCGADLPPY